MITLDKKTTVKLLKQSVKEKGKDYVYEGNFCAYVAHGKPSCLVGHVLFKAGADLRGIKEGMGITELDTERHGVHLTARARAILTVAQVAQDRRYTWGQALAEALEA